MKTQKKTKTLKQTQDAIKRFEKKYTNIFQLKRALDRFYMRNNLDEDAFEFFNEKMTKIEFGLNYVPKYRPLY